MMEVGTTYHVKDFELCLVNEKQPTMSFEKVFTGLCLLLTCMRSNLDLKGEQDRIRGLDLKLGLWKKG